MKILKGRTLGDLTGNLTFYKRSGNSVVDNVICSKNLSNKVIAFKDKHITNFSDHCQLFLTLNMKLKNNCNRSTSLKDRNSQKIKPKYIWNEDSKHNLLNFFHNSLLNTVATTVKQIANPEDKLEIINGLLISACNQCI